MDSSNQPSRADSAIEYPTRFPIKVLGAQAEGFAQAMAEIACVYDPHFDASTIEQRQSSGGKYLGLTLSIWATSRAQLDALYHALSAHPMVKVVL